MPVRRLAPLLLALALPLPALAAAPIGIVAAENFYGDVARQIGGDRVAVTSVLSNPDEDPHLFEASPTIAREVASARILVMSGADYDPWMGKLAAASRTPGRRSIVVAPLAARAAGDNPHVWYDTQTMLAYAAVLEQVLAQLDPSDAPAFASRLATFQSSIRPIQTRIARMRDAVAGTRVTATEPVFGYMLDALGLVSLNPAFQLAVMNNTEPSAADVATFETSLRNGSAHMLVYNAQASDPVASRMEKLAQASHVPVIGASETEPPGKTYQAWMTDELDQVTSALHVPAG